MIRLDMTFQRLRRQGRQALIPYVTAGNCGVDIILALMRIINWAWTRPSWITPSNLNRRTKDQSYV